MKDEDEPTVVISTSLSEMPTGDTPAVEAPSPDVTPPMPRDVAPTPPMFPPVLALAPATTIALIGAVGAVCGLAGGVTSMFTRQHATGILSALSGACCLYLIARKL